MQSRALATIGTGAHERLLTYSGESFRRYARKHGYEYVQGSGAMAEQRPPAWAKIPLLQHLLEGFEIVVWIDSDAFILDDSRDIAAELDEDTWQALVAHRVGDQLFPNTGVWVLRRSTEAHEFLRAIWNSTDFIERDYWENAAVLQLLGFTYTPPIQLVDNAAPWLKGTQWLPEEWNRLTHYTRRLEPGRIRHLAGERDSVRLRQMRADLAALDGRRLRPAVASVEWTLRGWRPQILLALFHLVESIKQRRRRHPLWYPYRTYKGMKRAVHNVKRVATGGDRGPTRS